jgi:hypothetical protein
MAGEEITLDHLRQLLSIQTELREQAESRWRKGQKALVSLLETFAPEEADRRLKSGQPLDSLPLDELEQLIRHHVGLRVNHHSLPVHSRRGSEDLEADYRKKQTELEELRVENSKLKSRTEQLGEENQKLHSQVTALQQVTEDEQRLAQINREKLEAVEKSPNSEPSWMLEWRRSDSFDRDANVLKMIGETGPARRPLIEAQAAELLGIKTPGGSIQSLIARLTNLGVIQIFRPWQDEGAGSGGRLPDLMRLTDLGEIAVWLLTGKKAEKNEYDLLLERHVTPEHTLLNLMAGDVLREAGYAVNLTPPDIKLPNGALFKPDIILRDERGTVLYVEVEREANKDIEQRQAKWRNFHQASGGVMYVFCDNKSGMNRIISEMNYALGNQSAIIFLTNLVELQAGKRGVEDSIWLKTKRKGQFGRAS